MLDKEETMVLFEHQPMQALGQTINRTFLTTSVHLQPSLRLDTRSYTLGVSGPRILTKTGTVQITGGLAYVNDCYRALNSLIDQRGLSAGAAHDSEPTISHLKIS